VPCGGLKDGQVEVVIYTYQVNLPIDVFFLEIYRQIFIFKIPWLPIQTGFFHLKSPKNENSFFWGEGIATFMYTGYRFKSPLK